MQKCGLADRKRDGSICRLVKLQRPPPDSRIFLPSLLARSITSTWGPRWPAVNALIKPAAPPPITMTSKSFKISPSLYGSLCRNGGNDSAPDHGLSCCGGGWSVFRVCNYIYRDTAGKTRV